MFNKINHDDLFLHMAQDQIFTITMKLQMILMPGFVQFNQSVMHSLDEILSPHIWGGGVPEAIKALENLLLIEDPISESTMSVLQSFVVLCISILVTK